MSSQAKTENYGLCQYGDNDIPDWRTDYTGDMAVIDDELANINKEVTGLKKSVSDGKEKIATAITEKGVATESTDSADVMAENIRKIPSGGNFGTIVNTSPYTHPYGYATNIYGVLPTETEVS